MFRDAAAEFVPGPADHPALFAFLVNHDQRLPGSLAGSEVGTRETSVRPGAVACLTAGCRSGCAGSAPAEAAVEMDRAG
jgi:hypothetical protein